MSEYSIEFVFDRTKAVETILYIANRISEPDKYSICKMIYLADRLSLDRYGDFIFGESYSAMKHGATPSGAYDLIKNATKRNKSDFTVDGYVVVPSRDADNRYLSEADIECLDDVIAEYNGNLGKMIEDAHDDAWQKAWNSRGLKGSNNMPIESIVYTLPDAEDLIEYLTDCGVD